jgi:hypothetical protein
MDSNQIYKILKSNPSTRRGFLGVFSADNLPETVKRFPSSLVVNTDKSAKPGIHWQAIFMPNRHTIEFFDSFGRGPSGLIHDWIQKQRESTTRIVYHRTKKIKSSRLQNLMETSCGPHVIYFLVSRSRGISFERIVNNMMRSTGDLEYSDSFVKFFTNFLIQKSV